MRRHLTDLTASPAARAQAVAAVTVGAVTLPIVVSALRAALGSWTPTGDDAYFTVRSRDVLTNNHPLLGAWSSGSAGLQRPINNLGPMQLDLLAPFTRFTPIGGTAIGTACVNSGAIVAVAVLVARTAGRRAMVAAMGCVALLTWTMGSEMLITPRQHQAMILPYLCVLVATWAVATGDRWAAVVFVTAASLVAQTHLSYPVLVAAMTLVAIIGQIAATRAGVATGGRRPLVVSGVLAGLLWLQPLIDQVAGRGNLGDVLFGTGGAERAGWNTGARIVAGVLGSTDTLLRPGYRQFDSDVRVSGDLRLVVCAVVLVVTIGVLVRLVKAGKWTLSAPGWVAVVAVVAGAVDAALLPRNEFGLVIGNYRWLWATGAFLLMTLLIGLDRWSAVAWTGSRRGLPRQALVAAAAVLCVVPAIANLPHSFQHSGASRYAAEQRSVAALREQLDVALDHDDNITGPLLIDDSGMYFGHGFTYPTLLMLQEHAISFRFEDARQVRRFGTGRASDGSEAYRLELVAGERALEARSSKALLAFVDAEPPVAILLVGI